MIGSEYLFSKGEIRKPKDKGQVSKVLCSDSEVHVSGEIQEGLDLFIPIARDKFHAIVIEDRYQSLIDPTERFYLVRLVTHCSDFDNLKLQEDWIISNPDAFLKLDSFITQDKFVIREVDINRKRQFGILDVEKIG